MLVLNRKVGESVIIDGRIKITVLQMLNGKMRLGFDAPEDVAIDREEVHLEKLRSEKGDRP